MCVVQVATVIVSSFRSPCRVFFSRQKTAYEMRISDWSSDVCSSDLPADRPDVVLAIAELDFAAQAVAESVAEGTDRRPAVVQVDASKIAVGIARQDRKSGV